MNITNKTVLITGANSAIGKATAMALAHKGAYIIMLCRNKDKAERARDEIRARTDHPGIDIIQADLSHQHDIRRAAATINDRFDALDVLINNAGVIPGRRNTTPDGIEYTVAVNHLAPFMLTNLLMPSLQEASGARIITVSSIAHRIGAHFFDPTNLQLETRYTPMKAYGLSKLYNIMFTHSMSKKLQGHSITANTLHPGVIRTSLASDASWTMKLFYTIGAPFMRSPSHGAETSVYLATAHEGQEVSGRYFINKRVAPAASVASDDEACNLLWKRSEELTGITASI